MGDSQDPVRGLYTKLIETLPNSTRTFFFLWGEVGWGVPAQVFVSLSGTL